MSAVQTQRYPKCKQIHLLANGSDTTTYTPPAHFLQVQNNGDQLVWVTFNGDVNASFYLDANSSVTFNPGDILIQSVNLTTAGISGAVATDLQLISGQQL